RSTLAHMSELICVNAMSAVTPCSLPFTSTMPALCDGSIEPLPDKPLRSILRLKPWFLSPAIAFVSATAGATDGQAGAPDRLDALDEHADTARLTAATAPSPMAVIRRCFTELILRGWSDAVP